MQKIKEAPVRWPPGRHRCRCHGNTGPALQSCSRRSAQCTDSQTTRAGSRIWRQQAARYHRNAESINFKSAIKAVSAHLNEPGVLTQVAPFWQPWTPPDSTWHSFTSVSQRGPFGSDKTAGNVKETDSVVHCQTRRPLISDLKSFKVCFFNLYYVWKKRGRWETAALTFQLLGHRQWKAFSKFKHVPPLRQGLLLQDVLWTSCRVKIIKCKGKASLMTCSKKEVGKSEWLVTSLTNSSEVTLVSNVTT